MPRFTRGDEVELRSDRAFIRSYGRREKIPVILGVEERIRCNTILAITFWLFFHSSYNPEFNLEVLLNQNCKSNVLDRQRPRIQQKLTALAQGYLLNCQPLFPIVKCYFRRRSVYNNLKCKLSFFFSQNLGSQRKIFFSTSNPSYRISQNSKYYCL